MIDKNGYWQITAYHLDGDGEICLYLDIGRAMTEGEKRRFMLMMLAACVKSLADDVATDDCSCEMKEETKNGQQIGIGNGRA